MYEQITFPFLCVRPSPGFEGTQSLPSVQPLGRCGRGSGPTLADIQIEPAHDKDIT